MYEAIEKPALQEEEICDEREAIRALAEKPRVHFRDT